MLALAKTITTIQIKLPLNKEVYTQTMLMARHQKIAKLFDEEFQTVRLKRAESPKALSPGHRLGIIAINKTPCKGKSFIYCLFLKLLPLQGGGFAFIITKGDALG